MSNADEIEDTSAPLIEHLAELRSRLIKSLGAFVVAMVICFTVWNPIFDFLTQPLCDALAENGQQDCGLVMIALQEGFFVAVSISMLGGLVLSFPVISYQLWRFVAPGLYKSEKNAFLPFLLASPIMFILGAAFAFYVITPMAFTFFLNFQQAGATAGTEATSAGINYLGSAQSYLSLTMKFIIAFGLCFQLPVLLTLMGKAGLVSANGLRSVRKYAVVGILILAAIATPPDVVSQIILFSVVYGLYEVSIQLVARVEKARIERLKAEGLYFEDDEDEADDEAKA
ncbi:twin-arginine translocase subunit TatC [Marivivens sp. JLT3646]|uniref:twin-arginine translocase subunit TatC n=1 Tax=Marivivens sp. JLT3646 TaxID=1920883 RepID=UPI0007FF37BA|nr:twin-arginine translocase subunit TatC [Marivivens sp. JLT3646]APO86426.1 twin arginine-targeting protein translocase TatC [Marivivens sp. JLT3646]OBR37785.1 twin arginine-targeting protein translocase TatC [Donghicola sp. JL3646]